MTLDDLRGGGARNRAALGGRGIDCWIVPPSGAGPLKLCLSIDQFAEFGGREVSAIAVADVGSSALGSAAFARNVADAIGRPVAAVVSGYGWPTATEALGGFVGFGALNGLRHSFENLDRLSQPTIVAAPMSRRGRIVVRRARTPDP